MEPQKIDRRVRRTKKILLQSLTQLMSEKKINKITVKELTDLADVNRATFYLYYKDIYDMIEQIETDMFNDFSKAWTKYSNEMPNYDTDLSFFTYLFEFVQTNSDMIKILLGPDGDYKFIQKFTEAIEKDHPPVDDHGKKISSQYLITFLSSGCIGAIQQWLEDDMNIPPNDMAATIIGIIHFGCGCLNK